MDLHERIAAEARGLVGAPFRLRGRSADTGLDCVGLLALAAVRAGIGLRDLPDYPLRGMDLARAAALMRAGGLRPCGDGCPSPGSVLIVESGPMQLHLMIATARGLVHAHASLGKVVLAPFPSPWPVLGRWRFIQDQTPWRHLS